jgi:hypothetical protein
VPAERDDRRREAARADPAVQIWDNLVVAGVGVVVQHAIGIAGDGASFAVGLVRQNDSDAADHWRLHDARPEVAHGAKDIADQDVRQVAAVAGAVASLDTYYHCAGQADNLRVRPEIARH